jgi:hypothetical protein
MTTPRLLCRPLAPALAALLLLAATSGCIIDYQLGQEPTRVTVRVEAEQAWTDTHVDLAAGDRLQIDALGGTWSPWPGGRYGAIGAGGDPLCDCNQMMGVSHAALIARLGDGHPFLVGDHWDQIVGDGGRLYLGINDTRLGDNSGSLEVRIETQS